MRVLTCLAAAASLQAGVIRGVVLERSSGLPLARAIVRLQPVPKPGSELKPIVQRSGNAGQFVFLSIPDGLYLLTATREGFFPAGYNQSRPSGQSRPIEITADSDLFTELRMYHNGAITGRVLDQNRVGIENVPVVAYRAKLPMRLAGRGFSDDRGVYRIHGLEPGKYWVRTVAHTLDDGTGLLPTFGPETSETREGRLHQVMLDQDAMDADVYPIPGRLFHLRGQVQCNPVPPSPVMVTLSSETGRLTIQSGCGGSYTFEGLAPGRYEVFAQKRDESEAGFVELFLSNGTETGTVTLQPMGPVDIDVRGAGSSTSTRRNDSGVKLFGRRDDLSDVEPDHEIALPRPTLAPGYWEMSAIPPPGQYIESIENGLTALRRNPDLIRPPDWFDVFLEARFRGRITITVAGPAAQISGTVLHDGKPAAGAPVFLWPETEAARRAIHGNHQTISDINGHYHFDGLPPGSYRIVASFDFSDVDEDAITETQAQAVQIKASQASAFDAQLWIAP